ncbi:phage Gp37/Gp68 family protein [uncultured Cohaesibacter sp.]|uniref:phage Gp37/Gp68 family protein n=1 Tax=uncultured Cohaesibacter sp. TaxID=1002546 RepID=UPI0029C8A0C9|nr:phage Gp37/Gp68 family protein [uncultured Cohaesibacter sp.]
MVENSKIEWTDHTFNPWMGCAAVSPACDHCYAEAQTARFKQVGWGTHADRKRTSEAYWRQPLLWNDKAEKSGVRFKVFCASLGDVFDNHKSILPQWREDLWDLIRATPNLDWLLLTKRPQNFCSFLPGDWTHKPLKNVWLGVTVENQQEADRRIPILLNTPASKRFLSCEPLLGALDIRPWIPTCYECGECGLRLAEIPNVECCEKCGKFCGPDTEPLFSDGCPKCGGCLQPVCPDCGHHMVYQHPDTPNIDWVICGGESGPHARPMHPDWARSLRDQCQAAGVPFFFKQWGAWAPILDRDIEDSDWRAPYGKYERSDRHCFLNLKGGCGFHGDRLHVMERRGFKNAGHLLDGKEWRQMPGDKDA